MMTKKFLLITAVLLTTVISFSQEMRLGLRAGTNIAHWNIRGEGSEFDAGGVAGIEAALLAEIPVARSLSVQPELVFSGYGSDISNGGYTNRYSLKYLSVPLLARYQLPHDISLFAGPQLSMLMSAQVKESGVEKQDIKQYLKTNDVFAVIGVGYDSPVGVSIGLRYNHGLVNIYRDGSEGSIKNSSFGISLAYKLATRRK